MEKRKMSVRNAVCFLLVLVLLPFMPAFAQQKPHEKREIKILTFNVGSSTYVLGIALADLINKNSTWLKASAMESQGVNVNAKILALEPENRKNTLIWTSQTTLWMLKNKQIQGVDIPYDSIKAVSMFGRSGNSFVSLDPNIKTVNDLAGKTVALAPKGIWGMSTFHSIMFNRLGIKANFKYMGFDAGMSALKDGLVDAAIAGTIMVKPDKWAPNPGLQALIATNKPSFISYDKDRATAALQKWGAPMMLWEIPPKQMGPTQTETWITTGLGLLWGADIEMPNDIVYEISRIIYENTEKFSGYHVTGRAITKETMALVETTDRSKVHPGALKFYDEKGLGIGF
ncbi:MAG: TAXI family TRAP transporter solute-binding subunit [Desulfobacterales bacterium]|nr:TAXI family TRAP transporter solute-binding subunit [Desulfobacterales bacterium]